MADKLDVLIVAVAAALGGVFAGYETFLSAPAKVATRPEIAEIGFWTGLFSGRFHTWLFYHEPVVGAVLYVTAFALMGAIVARL